MKFLIILLLSPLFLLAEAWALMVLVATVHGEWLPMMPTLSYWSAVKVALAATLLTVICSAAYGISKGVIDE
jgi:hypothetical protein